jgi:hypothetical protein
LGPRWRASRPVRVRAEGALSMQTAASRPKHLSGLKVETLLFRLS